MLLRRFSFPPAEVECPVVAVVVADAGPLELWPLTSYWFIEPRRIENQRDSRENGSDEMEGEELVELGEAVWVVVTRDAEPGLMMPVGGMGEEVTGAVVVDMVDACSAFRPVPWIRWLLVPLPLLLRLLLTRSAIRWTLPPAPPPAAATCC